MQIEEENIKVKIISLHFLFVSLNNKSISTTILIFMLFIFSLCESEMRWHKKKLNENAVYVKMMKKKQITYNCDEYIIFN